MREPRETILSRGGRDLDEAELLALILGSARSARRRRVVRSLAAALLEHSGCLRRLSTMKAAEMMDFRGIGPAGAARLLAAFALARRLFERRIDPGVRVRSSRDVFEHLHLRLRDHKKEIFLVMLLDSKHRLIREERVSEGSLTASIVHPREVFKPAISELAGAVIAVHNHPSGDPTPSNEDFEITRRLREAGQVIGIQLLDHVILGDGEFVSFREHRLIEW
jgi:DNA repair protein RadC